MRLLPGLSFLVTLLVPMFMFGASYECRDKFPLRAISSVAVAFGLAVLVELLNYYLHSDLMYYFSLLFYFCISIATVFISFKIDFYRGMFVFTGGLATQHLSNGLSHIFSYYISLNAVWHNLINLIFLAVTCVTVYFIFIKRSKTDGYVKERDFIAIIMATVIIIINVIVNELCSKFVTEPFAKNVMCKLYAVICCILVFVVEFGYFSRNKLFVDKNILSKMIREKELQFESLKNNINSINIKAHDLKRCLAALKVSDGGEDKARLIDELEENLKIHDSFASTGNKALDVILMDKNIECANKSIKLCYNLDGEALNFMNTVDVYVLFSNALDNAVQSAESESGEENRFINVSCGRKSDYVYLNFNNRCSEKLRFADGLPVTVRDPDLHGFGTLSIREIVKKYKGILKMSQENGTFYLDIVFPCADPVKI